MEKSSLSPPGGQVNEPKPLRSRMTFGRYRIVQHTTPEQAEKIGKSPSKLKAFRDAALPFAHLARIADVSGARDPFPPDRFALDDVRDAMVAGNFEPFFSILALYQSDAERHCLSDPTIYEIIRGWEKAANSGNRAARALLDRRSRALERAAYRRPPLPATEQPLSKRDAVAVFNAVSRRLQRYIAFREERSPAEARSLIEDELQKNRRILPKRKLAILSSFRGKAKKQEEARSGHKA